MRDNPAIVRYWSGFDMRYPLRRARVKQMSNPKLH